MVLIIIKLSVSLHRVLRSDQLFANLFLELNLRYLYLDVCLSVFGWRRSGWSRRSSTELERFLEIYILLLLYKDWLTRIEIRYIY